MEGCSFRCELVNAKRIVVKVGTSTLTYENGKINFSKIDKLARVLSDLMNQDKEIISYIWCGRNRCKQIKAKIKT
jgi:glutamate 5-kinase